jgi:hypothetical protein
MKKFMSLIVAVAIAVFAAASSVVANDNGNSASAIFNHAPTVSAMQDDDQMGSMKPKKGAGKGMKKMSMKKKTMSMKKKSTAKKGMNMKKKPMKKKSGMGDMKMKDMD